MSADRPKETKLTAAQEELLNKLKGVDYYKKPTKIVQGEIKDVPSVEPDSKEFQLKKGELVGFFYQPRKEIYGFEIHQNSKHPDVLTITFANERIKPINIIMGKNGDLQIPQEKLEKFQALIDKSKKFSTFFDKLIEISEGVMKKYSPQSRP